MSGRSQPDLRRGVIAPGISTSVPAVVLASAVPGPEPSPGPADTRRSKIAARGNAGSAETPHSSPGGRSRNIIFFLGMTLALLTTRCLGFFRPLAPDSVAPTLRLPLLLAALGLAVAMPRLPLPPSPGLPPASIAAVARQGAAGSEPPLASLQQTNPTSRTANWVSPPRSSDAAVLIFSGSWTIFTRAHGRSCSQKLKPRRGRYPLRGSFYAWDGTSATLPQPNSSEDGITTGATSAWDGSNLVSQGGSLLPSAEAGQSPPVHSRLGATSTESG